MSNPRNSCFQNFSRWNEILFRISSSTWSDFFSVRNTESYQESSQNYERGFSNDFIRFSLGLRLHFRIRILSEVIATSETDLGKEIIRSFRIRNWLNLQSCNQNLVQNFLTKCISKYRKTMLILIRILIGKCRT